MMLVGWRLRSVKAKEESGMHMREITKNNACKLDSSLASHVCRVPAATIRERTKITRFHACEALGQCQEHQVLTSTRQQRSRKPRMLFGRYHLFRSGRPGRCSGGIHPHDPKPSGVRYAHSLKGVGEAALTCALRIWMVTPSLPGKENIKAYMASCLELARRT